jgi:hypothetical protein
VTNGLVAQLEAQAAEDSDRDISVATPSIPSREDSVSVAPMSAETEDVERGDEEEEEEDIDEAEEEEAEESDDVGNILHCSPNYQCLSIIAGYRNHHGKTVLLSGYQVKCTQRTPTTSAYHLTYIFTCF